MYQKYIQNNSSVLTVWTLLCLHWMKTYFTCHHLFCIRPIKTNVQPQTHKYESIYLCDLLVCRTGAYFEIRKHLFISWSLQSRLQCAIYIWVIAAFFGWNFETSKPDKSKERRQLWWTCTSRSWIETHNFSGVDFDRILQNSVLWIPLFF